LIDWLKEGCFSAMHIVNIPCAARRELRL